MPITLLTSLPRLFEWFPALLFWSSTQISAHPIPQEMPVELRKKHPTCHRPHWWRAYFASRLTTGRRPPLMESKNDTANPPNSRIQRVKGWFRKKSTKKAAQPGLLHTSDHEVPSRAESTAENGVDTLVLVADIVEKFANVVNKAPLIAPVAALVSEVFKTVKEVKEMRGSRDTLHTELRDKMRDLGTAACQESSYKHSGERLREDLKVYRGLLEEASKLVSDFDARGSFKTSVQYPAWKRKFDDLEKKITSFEGRFILRTTCAKLRKSTRQLIVVH
ncbi:hypothetical protein B0H13DRAFT_1921862 [Mycena leptocephala]|nr:hypothetical protein B0H13DRAFT_1921862 [Mycena leptocephala]